jgi:hypothetical protein
MDGEALYKNENDEPVDEDGNLIDEDGNIITPRR